MSHRVALALALSAAVAAPLAACKRDPKVAAPAAPATTPLARLADELDGEDAAGQPAQPLWPTLPESARRELEQRADAPAMARAARGGAAPARRVVARFALRTALRRCGAPAAPGLAMAARRARWGALRDGIEGLFLAEPIVYAPERDADARDQLAATALLFDFYARLDQPAFATWLRETADPVVDRAVLERLVAEAGARRRQLGARLLRRGEPADGVTRVLRDTAARKLAAGDAAGARPLYALVIERRGADATFDDWLDAAVAHTRAEDRAGAAAALDRARKLAQPGNRDHVTRLRHRAFELTNLERYLALGAPGTLAGHLERVDYLRGMGRDADARALVDELRRMYPTDARVRARYATLQFEEIALAQSVMAGAAFVAEQLSDPALTDKDGSYWGLWIGAQGVRAMTEAVPELSRDREAGTRKMVEILTRTREMNAELAKWYPGRAAALEFLLGHTIDILGKTTPRDVATVELLRRGLDDVLALRARHADPDVDRLVYTFATFAPDAARALAVVAQRPSGSPEEEFDLYGQRARTAVTLAAVVGTPAAIATARAAVEDIRPSYDDALEATREALLGDCDVLDALVQPDAEAWARAARRYEAARAHPEVAARATHNLGWIALATGDKARAAERFREAAQLDSPRRYLSAFNAVYALGTPAEQLDATRSLGAGTGSDEAPPLMLVWRAALATDPAEAAEAAKGALAQMDEPFYRARPGPPPALGIEPEGFFQLGFGFASRRFYALNSVAYANLWLMPPPPLDRAGLEAKAKTKAKPKPKPNVKAKQPR